MATPQQIDRFLSSPAFGVVGASSNRDKYGNKVLRCYLMRGKDAIPVNPNETTIEGVSCVPSLGALPPSVKSISVITPPAVTERIVEEAIAAGIENIWMQPGSQSIRAIERCREANLNLIADGSCILVVLGYQE
ncbi:MAG: CoA-binding protein [Desulfuromonadia bacterium]